MPFLGELTGTGPQAYASLSTISAPQIMQCTVLTPSLVVSIASTYLRLLSQLLSLVSLFLSGRREVSEGETAEMSGQNATTRDGLSAPKQSRIEALK